MTSTTERIYSIVSKIPKGKVSTYGDIAKLAGLRSPRVVGNALHRNQDWKKVPCHRIVNVAGRLAPAFGFGPGIQETRLKREGVTFVRKGKGTKLGIVDLSKHRWQSKATA